MPTPADPAEATSPEPSPPSARDTTPGRRWVQRAEGDRRSRARLTIIEEGDEEVVVLNDRRVPGSKNSIDLIAVSTAGVFVIDTESFKGLVHTKRPGSMAALGRHELHVGRRNCTSAVDEVVRHKHVVEVALAAKPLGAEVPVSAMLCLTRAEWGFASAIEIEDVWVGWPKLINRRVRGPGVMDTPAVYEVSQMIAEQLPVS